MTPPPTILIAGIGNIFLGDDAFGSEVARRLELRTWPEGVRVVDFGIRGLDLAYALLDGHDLTILIDATPRGGRPGTLYVIEPDLSVVDEAGQNGTLSSPYTRSAQGPGHGPDDGRYVAADAPRRLRAGRPRRGRRTIGTLRCCPGRRRRRGRNGRAAG